MLLAGCKTYATEACNSLIVIPLHTLRKSARNPLNSSEYRACCGSPPSVANFLRLLPYDVLAHIIKYVVLSMLKAGRKAVQF